MTMPGEYKACVVSMLPINTEQWQFNMARSMTGEYLCAGHTNQRQYYVRLNGYNVYFDNYWGWCIGRQLGGHPEAWCYSEKDGSIPEKGWRTCGYLGWHDALPLQVRTVVVQHEPEPTYQSLPGTLLKAGSASLRNVQENLPPADQVMECLAGAKVQAAALGASCLNEAIVALYGPQPEQRSLAAAPRPQRPCCSGVVRDASGLKGKECVVASQRAYFARPDVCGSAAKVGVLVVHDIFGFGIPNNKYIVDYLAGQGFHALMPDFYCGKGLSLENWPATEFDAEPMDKPEFGSWWGEITSADFMRRTADHALASVEFLRANGCTSFAVVGFCWGGLAAENLAALGCFASCASIHGVHGTADGYLAGVAAGCKEISYHTVPEDAMFPAEAVDALRIAGANVRVWDGMYHGFVVRGDFQNKPEVRDTANQVMLELSMQCGKLQGNAVPEDLTAALQQMEQAIGSIESCNQRVQQGLLENALQPVPTDEPSAAFEQGPCQQCTNLARQKGFLESTLAQLKQEQQVQESSRKSIEETYLKNNQELEAVATLATDQIVQLKQENESLRSSSQATSGDNALAARLQGDLLQHKTMLRTKEAEIETLASLKTHFEKRHAETSTALESAHASLVDKTTTLEELRAECERYSRELEDSRSQQSASRDVDTAQAGFVTTMREEMDSLNAHLNAAATENDQTKRAHVVMAQENSQLQASQTKLEGEIFTLKCALEEKDALVADKTLQAARLTQTLQETQVTTIQNRKLRSAAQTELTNLRAELDIARGDITSQQAATQAAETARDAAYQQLDQQQGGAAQSDESDREALIDHIHQLEAELQRAQTDLQAAASPAEGGVPQESDPLDGLPGQKVLLDQIAELQAYTGEAQDQMDRDAQELQTLTDQLHQFHGENEEQRAINQQLADDCSRLQEAVALANEDNQRLQEQMGTGADPDALPAGSSNSQLHIDQTIMAELQRLEQGHADQVEAVQNAEQRLLLEQQRRESEVEELKEYIQRMEQENSALKAVTTPVVENTWSRPQPELVVKAPVVLPQRVGAAVAKVGQRPLAKSSAKAPSAHLPNRVHIGAAITQSSMVRGRNVGPPATS